MNLQRQSYFSVSSEGVPIRNIADYSPFGVQLDGRTISMDSYRYGFQNQEKDDEIKGAGNSLNFEYRMHDPRVGRFFAVDPLARKYSYNSPYAFSENSLTAYVELEGLEKFFAVDGSYLGKIGDSKEIRIVNDESVWKEYKNSVVKNNDKLNDKKTAKAEFKLLKNSTIGFKREDLWGPIKRWGEANAPLSQDQEYGVVIFSRSVTDEDGSQFNVFVMGTTETQGARRDFDPDYSSLIIGGEKFGGRKYDREFGFSNFLESGWSRFAVAHTHPENGSDISPGDMGYGIKNDMLVYMFKYSSNDLFKFDPFKYCKYDKLVSRDLIEYKAVDFDQQAIQKATKKYENAINPIK